MISLRKFAKWFVISFIAIAALAIFIKYFLTYEQRNSFKREIENITGQNLTVTVFDVNGKIIKRWYGVKKITSAADGKSYIYFFTSDNKYVQIPNSVWYVAEEN